MLYPILDRWVLVGACTFEGIPGCAWSYKDMPGLQILWLLPIDDLEKMEESCPFLTSSFAGLVCNLFTPSFLDIGVRGLLSSMGK